MRLKKILSLLLAMTMLLSCIGITAMAEEMEATEVATYEALMTALAEGKSVKLTADITATDAVDATNAMIDLGGKTLTLNVGGTNFYGNSVVKNGNISITGCVASGDCIIGIGDYSNDATLTLEDVNVSGDGYSSAYAVLYVYNSSTLNINGGSIVVFNDNASAGGVIKAHSAANGKINITGTENDPVELTFTNAKIGILDGAVVMDYVDLDITGGANAINQSALTIKNSALTIKDCDGRALTLSQGNVSVENSILDFSGAAEGEIRFKKGLSLAVDENSTINACDIYADTSAIGANVNGKSVTGTESEPQTVIVADGVTTIKSVSKGTITPAYIRTDVNRPVWGEAGANATESFEIKLYSDETVVATTVLNNIGGIIDGDVYVTWSFFVENTDEYWTTTWTEGYPNASMKLDKVELYADGVKVAENEVQLNAPDNLNKIVAAAEDKDGNFIGYATDIQEAIKAAAPAGTVEIVNDVVVDKWIMFSERLGIGSGQIITIDEINGLTIEGKGHSLTINGIESASNGNRLFYDATNLNVKDLTINYADGVVGGIGLTSGTISNVTFNGGVGILPGEGNITITGCKFNTSGSAIYNETDRDNLVVTYNHFETAAGQYAIYLRGNTTFSNNTVVSGKVNVTTSATGEISGNDFGQERFKVYNGATATISNNTINNLVFNDETTTAATFTNNTMSEEAQTALNAVSAPATPVATKAELDSAIAAAQEGDTILLTSDIDYTGTSTLTINKAITLDLGGNTLTTYGTYGGLILKGNCSFKNGTLNHKGTVAAIKAWNVETIEDVVIDVAFKAEGKTIGGIVIQEGSANRIGTMKNVTIKGEGLTNGIETYNCGNATENVIGSMENVIIDARGTGMSVSAPCGTATNCNISGDKTGIELWIKGTYSASLDLKGCTVDGGEQALFIHDEFTSNPNAVNNGTLELTADDATTFENEKLVMTIARAENLAIDEDILKMRSLQGTGTAEDPYIINNLNDLKWFRDNVNTYTSDGSNQYKGKYVKLNADIDLAGENWEPIGNNANNDHESFMGIFDGGGHTIKNLYVNSDGDHLGFFARIGSYAEGINPTVKNITFENVDVSSNTLNGHGGSYVGGVIANAGGNSIVENVKVKGNIYVTGYGYVGGIVGHGYPDLTDCSVIGNEGSWVHAHYWCAGGIIGYAGEGGTPITNCQVEGLDIWSAYGAAAAVAGLLQDGNKLTNVSAKDVEITSNSDYCMGYIAGNGECSTMTEVTVTNVTATANGSTITATDAVAEVDGSIYFDLQTALKALTNGATLTLLADVTISDTWDSRYTGGKILVPVTIDGNGKTLKLTGAVDDKNWNTVFRFEDVATVKNLTIDVSEATGVQRGISSKLSITAENCNFIGNGSSSKRAIIFGEGAGDALPDVTATITGCTFINWTLGVSDNQSGKDAKSVSVTGSTFNNASVLVSASETVTFTGNEVTNGYVNIKSYTADNTCNVTATDNTLDLTKGEDNKIDAGGEINAQDGFIIPFDAVAEVNGVGYKTLQAAIDEANEGDTIILLDNVNEDVTINKSITLDGGNFKYTGNISVSGSTSAVTVKNVKFENGTGYAITTNRIKSITVEDCTVNNYGYGFLYANKSTPTVVVKNVTVDGGNYGFHWVYGTSATLENVTMTNVTNGLLIQNYAGKTVTLKNCNLSNINIWERDGYSGVQTFKFEGSNTVSALSSSQYAKYVLAAADATLTAPEGYNVTTDLEGYIVKYDEDKYSLKQIVAKIGDNYYETFEAALNAVEDGETITLLNVTGSELSKEIDFTKDISFTITGNAPDYALPVVTFQNATLTIKDAEILIPELDARQNATINVVDSIVHDAGGNSIVKSYYNGAINISGTSVVHTMQVTTMGYITISDSAKLNATWQTNVYGNGMITVKDNATFSTAALHLTGQDYSGRDNTDADRVGKPAAIVVDGANFTVGKVYSDSGADYSYNSSYGINIGTIDGKSAVLDIKNGAIVKIYMANVETANIGAGGKVDVSDSTLNVACRAENGTVTLANNGAINISGTSDIAAKVTGAGWVYMNGVTLDADTRLHGAKVRFASGTNNINGSVINDGFFQVGIGAYNGVDANVDCVNGVIVNVKNNAKIGSNGKTYAGWIGTGYYDTDAEKATAMTDAKYVLNIENSIAEFGYLHISNDGELNVKGNATEKVHYNNSDYSFYSGDFIINGAATFDATDVLALYTKVSCDNGTDKPGTLNIVNDTYYEAERHNGAISGENFILYKTGVVNVENAELYIGEYTSIATDAVMNIGGEVTALGKITNNGKINLTTVNATLTTPEAPVVNSAVDGCDVIYADGKYIMKKVNYVAQIGDIKYTSLQEALDAAAASTGNVTVEILADIDLADVDWNPVTVSAPGYPVVTVNGNNKTITGLNDMLFAGTWAGGSGLIINDLTIADSNIVNDENDAKGTVGVGAFIGYPQASATITLNNCHLINSTVKGGHWTGGLIGMAGGYNGNDGPVFMNLTITDCSVTGSTITGKGSAGGIIGHGSCAAWTNVVIENTTVSGNTITSTGSSNNKAGAVMGTIGAAGQSTTVNGETKTGGASVSATVNGNTVKSNDITITTIYGRQGTATGMLYITGGNYDNYPIEENVSYAAPADGCEIVRNEDGTYGVQKVEMFEFYKMNLDLESSIKVNFYILASYFEEDRDYYAEIVHSSANGDITRKIDFADWKDNNSYKQISYTDLVAKNMADTITVTIYDETGKQISVAQPASIKTYAENYLRDNAGKDDKWVTSFVDMLNYGAEAQRYFNYNTENLANAGIDQYQIYATKNDVELTNIAEVFGPVYKANLDLENRIVYNGYFKDVTSDMTAEISYTSHTGKEISHPAAIVKSGSYYKVAVDTLVIADANQLVTITVYDGDGNVYAYIKDTVNSYLCRVIPNEPTFEALAKAMAKFTASAHTALNNEK